MSIERFVELNFDPGKKNLGQSRVEILNDADVNLDVSYVASDLRHIDCIGQDKKSSKNLSTILANLTIYLKTDPTIKRFIDLKDDKSSSIEVQIEDQRGYNIERTGFTSSMVEMGLISGAIGLYFTEKGIKVVFISKSAKWNPDTKTIVDTADSTSSDEETKPRKKKSKKKNTSLDDAKVNKKSKKNHKKEIKDMVLNVMRRQNTKKSLKCLEWMNSNKQKSQHVADSISGGMYRLKQRITEHRENNNV